MIVELKYNNSDVKAVNKSLTDGVIVSGDIVTEFDVVRPNVNVYYEGVMRYNYVRIPELQRYYHIMKKTAIANNSWRLELEVDPLMSFRGDILQTSALIDKSANYEHGDEYIDDGSLVSDNYNFTRIINFPDGFNASPELILITMG